MSQIPSESSPAAPLRETSSAERRRAILSSFLGSGVEYYDFLLYGAAAGLVFPKLFFSGLSPALGTTLSFLILLIGYVARPIGGLLFGHFGDRLGRKTMLVVTLTLMGLCSVGIGLLPGSAQIGQAAAIVLVLLRFVQGLAVGGEWAGSTLMAMEHAHEGSRGLGASLAVAGGPMGAVLSTFVLALFGAISGPHFVGTPGVYFSDWGWRVPFMLSAVIVLFGLYLRANLQESPEFEAARRAGDVHTGVPLLALFRNAPREVLLGCLAGMGSLAIQGLLAIFMVPYVVKHSGGAVTRDQALMMLTVSNFLHIFAIPAFAWISDRIGRRTMMLIGAVFSMVAIWPMFSMFNSSSKTVIGLAFILGNPIIQASMYGPIGAFLSEKFSPEYRYTGLSLTFQVSAVLGSGLIPLAAERLVTPQAGTHNLAIYCTALLAISGVAVLLSKETRQRQETHQQRFVETALVER